MKQHKKKDLKCRDYPRQTKLFFQCDTDPSRQISGSVTPGGDSSNYPKRHNETRKFRMTVIKVSVNLEHMHKVLFLHISMETDEQHETW